MVLGHPGWSFFTAAPAEIARREEPSEESASVSRGLPVPGRDGSLTPMAVLTLTRGYSCLLFAAEETEAWRGCLRQDLSAGGEAKSPSLTR